MVIAQFHQTSITLTRDLDNLLLKSLMFRFHGLSSESVDRLISYSSWTVARKQMGKKNDLRIVEAVRKRSERDSLPELFRMSLDIIF